MKKVVVIDPGHGGKDPGNVFQGRKESDDNLALALKIEEIIRKNNDIEAALTRNDDSFVSPAGRIEAAIDLNADFFVSLHRNASKKIAEKGFVIFIKNNIKKADLVLASMICDEMKRAGVSEAPEIKNHNYYVLRYARVPSVLAEVLYIDNPQDNALFDSSLDAYANAFAAGILKSVSILS